VIQLRFVGFRALFDSETDSELVSASLATLASSTDLDPRLLGNRNGRIARHHGHPEGHPSGPAHHCHPLGMDDESFLKAMPPAPRATWTRTASPTEFIQAWHRASGLSPGRRAAAPHLHRPSSSSPAESSGGGAASSTFTDREKKFFGNAGGRSLPGTKRSARLSALNSARKNSRSETTAQSVFQNRNRAHPCTQSRTRWCRRNSFSQQPATTTNFPPTDSGWRALQRCDPYSPCRSA